MSSATDRERAGEASGDGTAQTARWLVWDWPVRVFHWVLALCVLASWITANAFDLLDWHMIVGYVTLGLLAFRLCWGIVGTRYARFSQLLAGPQETLAYLRTLPRRNGQPPSNRVGHNPLGAFAIVALLGLLTVQAVTGLFASDELLHLGPYNGAVSAQTAEWLTSVHKANSDVLLVFIWIHIGAVLFYALYKRQNLITPMITGRKRLSRAVGERAAIVSSRGWLAIGIAVAAAGAVWLLVTLAPPPPAPDFF
jgi:cytochrome b